MKHLILIIIVILTSLASCSQNVVRKGNTFIATETKETKPIQTQYTFRVKGTEYPIYLSAKGKAYIIRTSKKGKEYKQYLPEVTKQLANEYKITSFKGITK